MIRNPLQLIATITVAASLAYGQERLLVPDIREAMPAIFKVHAGTYRYDYQQPWLAGGATIGSGSAFLIEGGLILTCGHVVADAISIELQPHGSSERYPATVKYIAYDADLAILELDDPSVADNLPVLKLEARASELGDEVFAVGYPMGGSRLSLTRGIVSRIDHAVYVFSGVDERLVMQIDAAINPGNSGGPVVNRENRVVGVAFQGIARGQALGFAVPVPVIRHFLQDVLNPPYRGVPQLYIRTFELRNPTLRTTLGLKEPSVGVVITDVSPFCAAFNRLQPGDVLLQIDNVPVQQDGSVILDNNNLPFEELVGRKQWGENIDITILRKGETQKVSFALSPEQHPFIFRRIYDRTPEYFMMGGLCFMPISRNYLMTISNESRNDLIPLFYYFQRSDFDPDITNRKQVITLGSTLPHPINTYTEIFQNQILRRMNHRDILELADMLTALQEPVDGFHILEFDAMDIPLILDADMLPAADQEIRARYGVTQLYNLRTATPEQPPVASTPERTAGDDI
jgi:S1-C subfamily serine protease